MPIKANEVYRAPIRLGQKRKYPWHIMIKTLITQGKDRILKASKEEMEIAKEKQRNE